MPIITQLLLQHRTVVFTYSFHHKSRLELKHVTTVGDLVEAAVNLHLYLTVCRYVIRKVFNTSRANVSNTFTTDERRKPFQSALYRTINCQ